MRIFKNTQLFYGIVILLIASSCKENEGPVCSDTWEADPVGQWYRGDLHVHATGASNDTGGDSYPSDIKEKAITNGLDFVVLTDHSNSTGSDADTTYEDPALFNMGPEFTYWDSAVLLSDANFLMVCGNEISPRDLGSEPTGHIGCIPANLSTFDQNYVFTDRPRGTVDGANTLMQAGEAGCYKILNHPYAFNRWIAFDWTSFDYDAMEVWNGTIGYDDFDKNAHQAWICDLLAGRQVSIVGGSDNHRVNTPEPSQVLDPALGYPTTMVFAESLTWDNIIAGLQRGQTAVVEGESRLFINDYTEGKCHAYGEDVAWIRLRGSVDANLLNPVLTLYYYNSCDDPRPATDAYPVASGEVLFEQSMQAGANFDEGIKVNGSTGVYVAVLNGDNFHYWALSKAVVIN